MEPQTNIPLAPLTTFRIGGAARYFCRINSIDQLKSLKGYNPIFILGGGSNILVSDDGFPGLVIKMELKGKEWSSASIRVAAGEIWDDIVRESVERKLYGLENLSGIPGTVGGAVVQNIGAYGAELKNILESVEVFNLKTGEQKSLSKEECQLDYRHSFFKTKSAEDLVITSALLRLDPKGKPNLTYKDLEVYFKNKSKPSLLEVRQAVLKIRQAKFPPLEEVGTAGSFFKNPIIDRLRYVELKKDYPSMPAFPVDEDNVKIPAAWLLDKIGNFRGVRRGNVGTYSNQALAIINLQNATALEIKSLADEIKKTIKERIGIELEEEVKFVGDNLFML